MNNFSLDGFGVVHMGPNNGLLKERRIMLGLTQQAVADKAEIPLQSYQQFESGKRKIKNASFNLACRVIEALDMDPTKFYHDDYTFGEEVYESDDGLRFKKTGRLTDDDPDEKE